MANMTLSFHGVQKVEVEDCVMKAPWRAAGTCALRKLLLTDDTGNSIEFNLFTAEGHELDAEVRDSVTAAEYQHSAIAAAQSEQALDEAHGREEV